MTWKNNIDVGRDCDFVLVSYGKDEELDEYVKEELFPYLWYRDQGGTLRKKAEFNYYQTDAEYFHMSKSKNLSHRLSNGEYLVCLDADTYIGPRMVQKSLLALEENKYMSSHWTDDIFGLPRKVFFELGGYDETFEGWGSEDVDMRIRCQNLGIKNIHMPPQAYKVITHGDEDRIANYAPEFRKIYNGNQEKVKLHQENKTLKVNLNGFTKHRVVKNFEEEFVI